MPGSILTLGLGSFSTVNLLPTLGYGTGVTPTIGHTYYNIAMFGIGPLFG